METPYVRLEDTGVSPHPHDEDGSNWDFLCGLLFGFLLSFIAILFVFLT